TAKVYISVAHGFTGVGAFLKAAGSNLEVIQTQIIASKIQRSHRTV
ncbi:MAG: hypothetical protein ACI90R_001392, partial [Alteromonas macleodii]